MRSNRKIGMMLVYSSIFAVGVAALITVPVIRYGICIGYAIFFACAIYRVIKNARAAKKAS